MASLAATPEELLGVRSTEQPRLALATSIERGMPVAAVERIAAVVAPGDPRFLFRLLPKATLERRRRTKQPLSQPEGERLARLAKVFGFATEVFGDVERARAFLGRPHPMLDGRQPLEVAISTGPGADAVINILGRARYGAAV